MKFRIGYVAAMVAGLAIGVTAVGSALAAPAAPKTVTHHYALAASAFAPDSLGNVDKDYYNQWDPTTLASTVGGRRCFNAGLSLPAGVTLKSITFYVMTGDSTMSFELNRQNLIKHTFVELTFGNANTTSTPTYTAVTKKIKASQAKVDMGRFAYSVGVCPKGTTTFSGIIVTYTQPG
jgi:hypothetical protein